MIETTAELLAEEEDWERTSIQRGIDRVRLDYEQANHKAAVSQTGGLVDTEVGSIVIKAVIRPLIEAIKAKQAEAVSAFQNYTRGTFARWWAPILCLEAEKWALITVRAALTGLTSELRDSRPTTPLALTIMKYGKLQREFDLWKAAEAERRKAAARSGEDYVDLYKLMMARCKNVNARNAKRWMKLAQEHDKLEWAKADMVQVGMILINLLVEHGGGWFRVELLAGRRGASYTTERHLILSEDAKNFIRNKQEKLEIQRPWLAPMLCQPRPWEFVPAETEV